RIRADELRQPVLAIADVVDLEPELHREVATLCLDDGFAVRLEVEDAALVEVGNVPQLERLAEVVDVLREPDLVDAPRRGLFDEALDSTGGECDLAPLVTEVHVVVDDHDAGAPSSSSTSSRSAGVVTLRSR